VITTEPWKTGNEQYVFVAHLVYLVYKLMTMSNALILKKQSIKGKKRLRIDSYAQHPGNGHQLLCGGGFPERILNAPPHLFDIRFHGLC